MGLPRKQCWAGNGVQHPGKCPTTDSWHVQPWCPVLKSPSLHHRTGRGMRHPTFGPQLRTRPPAVGVEDPSKQIPIPQIWGWNSRNTWAMIMVPQILFNLETSGGDQSFFISCLAFQDHASKAKGPPQALGPFGCRCPCR